MINRIIFQNRLVSNQLYLYSLSAGQLQGFNAIIDEWEANKFLIDIRWLAYIMATVYHETGRTMQPIEEFGKGKGKPYGHKLMYGLGPGRRVAYDEPDKIYYGRGHTQNTWKEIYEKLTRANKNGWDFVHDPDLLLLTRPSIWATFYAMTNGLYTGRKLAHYFDGSKEDPINARKIINGTDKSELIALYYRRFLDCLN